MPQQLNVSEVFETFLFAFSFNFENIFNFIVFLIVPWIIIIFNEIFDDFMDLLILLDRGELAFQIFVLRIS